MQINEDKVKERKSFCVPKGGNSQKLAQPKIGAAKNWRGKVINVKIKRMKEKVEAKNNKKDGAAYGFLSKNRRGR